jgi:hypothetical protein
VVDKGADCEEVVITVGTDRRRWIRVRTARRWWIRVGTDRRW